MVTKLSSLFHSHAALFCVTLFSHIQSSKETFKACDLLLFPKKNGQVQSGINLWGRAELLQYQHNVPGLECTSELLVYSWAYFTAQSVCTDEKNPPLGHKERNVVKAGRLRQLDEPSRRTVINHKHREKRLTSQSSSIWSHWYMEQNRKTDSLSKENRE